MEPDATSAELWSAVYDDESDAARAYDYKILRLRGRWTFLSCEAAVCGCLHDDGISLCLADPCALLRDAFTNSSYTPDEITAIISAPGPPLAESGECTVAYRCCAHVKPAAPMPVTDAALRSFKVQL